LRLLPSCIFPYCDIPPAWLRAGHRATRRSLANVISGFLGRAGSWADSRGLSARSNAGAFLLLPNRGTKPPAVPRRSHAPAARRRVHPRLAVPFHTAWRLAATTACKRVPAFALPLFAHRAGLAFVAGKPARRLDLTALSPWTLRCALDNGCGIRHRKRLHTFLPSSLIMLLPTIILVQPIFHFPSMDTPATYYPPSLQHFHAPLLARCLRHHAPLHILRTAVFKPSVTHKHVVAAGKTSFACS